MGPAWPLSFTTAANVVGVVGGVVGVLCKSATTRVCALMMKE